MRDQRLLYAAAFLRALGTGMFGVLIGIYLAKRGFNPAQTGAVVSAGLAGAAAAALLVTMAGDRLGRKRTLVVLAVLSAVGGLAMVVASNVTLLLAAAFVGMINGMGRDRGASLILDQALLPATSNDAGRTRAFALYNVFQDVGHAIGALLAAIPTVLRGLGPFDEMSSLRIAVLIYAGLAVLTALVYSQLSSNAEPPIGRRGPRVSPENRRTLLRISSLFAIDSVAGGFLTAALLGFFFYERFGVGEATIGLLFFGARTANAGSHLAAAWLARRIGLVNTMVFTHIPSSLLLLTVAYAPNFSVAAILFMLREGLVEMDVPTRQSYVMAVVRPEERTFASGITHLVRLGGWAVAPALAGFLVQGTSLRTPLFVGAALKIVYDILLFFAFRGLRPPEELG